MGLSAAGCPPVIHVFGHHDYSRTYCSTLFRRKLAVEIPVEFHFMAVIFIFGSLYLGEIQSFYHRFWWWDIALHASAGLLMGIIRFLLVYLLNESKRVELHMTPGFISSFAFLFAVTVGTLWEIFEFFMDKLFAFNMQKPMTGDLSGLTDTMCDMIHILLFGEHGKQAQ